MDVDSNRLGGFGMRSLRVLAEYFPPLKAFLRRRSQRHVDKAFESYLSGALEAAAQGYYEAMEWQPHDASLHSALGQIFYEQKKLDLAEREFQQALVYDYYNLRALMGLGNLLTERGDSAKAMYIYLRYLEVDPKDPIVLQNLAGTFYNLGNYDTAIDYYARAAQEDPDDWLIRKNQGLSLMAAGRKNEAREALEVAGKLNPEDGAIDRLLGDLFIDEDQADQAFERYMEAIKKDPDDAEVHFQLSLLYSKRGEFQISAEHAQSAAELFTEAGDPEGASQALWELGWDYYLLKEFEKSLDASTESLKLDPNQAAVYFNLGLVLLHIGREAEARKRYEDGIQNLAQIADLKYYAIEDLRDAYEKNPKLSGAAEILAMLEEKYAATSREIATTTAAEQISASLPT